jgi:hypothetical protein
MSATKFLAKEGDLIPFSNTVLELVYGDMDYVRSVLGTDHVTRALMHEYFERAKKEWTSISRYGISNSEIFGWTKKTNLRGLDYHVPFNSAMLIWFRNPHDAFLFRLHFGN